MVKTMVKAYLALLEAHYLFLIHVHVLPLWNIFYN